MSYYFSPPVTAQLSSCYPPSRKCFPPGPLPFLFLWHARNLTPDGSLPLAVCQQFWGSSQGPGGSPGPSPACQHFAAALTCPRAEPRGLHPAGLCHPARSQTLPAEQPHRRPRAPLPKAGAVFLTLASFPSYTRALPSHNSELTVAEDSRASPSGTLRFKAPLYSFLGALQTSCYTSLSPYFLTHNMERPSPHGWDTGPSVGQTSCAWHVSLRGSQCARPGTPHGRCSGPSSGRSTLRGPSSSLPS